MFERVEELFAASFVVVFGRKADPLRGPGGESLAEVFVHDDYLSLDERVDERHDFLKTDGAADIVEFHHGVVAEELYHA